MALRLVATSAGQLAFGLEWRVLSAIDKEAVEIRQDAAPLQSRKYVRYVVDPKEVTCGFLPGKDTKKLKGKAFSAAVLFAKYCGASEAVLYFIDHDAESEEGGPVAYLVGVKNGVPLSEFDVWGPVAEVKAKLREFVQRCAPNTPVFFGNDPEFHDATDITLEDLFQVGNKKDAEFKSVSSALPGRLVMGATILALAVGGYLWQDAQEQARRRAAMEEANADPDSLYAESLSAAMAKVNVSASDYYAAAHGVVGNIASRIGGWRFESATCDIARCTLALAKESGTFKTFADSKPANWTNVVYDESGNKVTAEVALPTFKRGLNAKAVPSREAFMRDHVSFTQELNRIGLTANFSKTQVFGAPPQLPGFKNFKAPVYEGTWRFSGKKYLDQTLARMPANVTITSYAVSVGGSDIQFRSEGRYYVKN